MANSTQNVWNTYLTLNREDCRYPSNAHGLQNGARLAIIRMAANIEKDGLLANPVTVLGE